MPSSAAMRIEHFLGGRADAPGSKVALVSGATRLGFADLHGLSDRLAGALVAEGIGRGDRIALLMNNSWEAVVTIFAAFKAGAAVVPVHPSTKSAKVAAILNHCGAAGLVTGAEFAAVAARAMAAAPALRLTVVAGAQGQPAVGGLLRFEDTLATASGPPPAVGEPADLATILYTVDSSGRLKGVATTHRTLIRSLASAAGLVPTADDIVLSGLPLASWSGLYPLFLAVMTGGTLVLERPGAISGSQVEHMTAERVSDLWLSSSMTAMLLGSDAFNAETLPSLGKIVHVGSPAPSGQLARLTALFPTADARAVYGLPECPAALVMRAADLPDHPGACGRSLTGTEATILDSLGSAVPAGVVGELVVHGANVADAYWMGDTGIETSPLVGCAFRTGDFFRSDADGFLYFVGRRDDIVKIDGENADPQEVEEVLLALPGVREAAVIGVPDPVFGHAFKAVVALGEGMSLGEREVIAHCVRNLEDGLVPRQVEFRRALPKTKAGAVNRQLIEEDAREAAE